MVEMETVRRLANFVLSILEFIDVVEENKLSHTKIWSFFTLGLIFYVIMYAPEMSNSEVLVALVGMIGSFINYIHRRQVRNNHNNVEKINPADSGV